MGKNGRAGQATDDTVFPRQQWFCERASTLRYTYIACLLFFHSAVYSLFGPLLSVSRKEIIVNIILFVVPAGPLLGRVRAQVEVLHQRLRQRQCWSVL